MIPRRMGLVITEFNPDHTDVNGKLAASFVRGVVEAISAASGA